MNIPKRGERLRSVKRLLWETKIKGNEPLLAHSPVANYHLKIKQNVFCQVHQLSVLAFSNFFIDPGLM